MVPPGTDWSSQVLTRVLFCDKLKHQKKCLEVLFVFSVSRKTEEVNTPTKSHCLFYSVNTCELLDNLPSELLQHTSPLITVWLCVFCQFRFFKFKQLSFHAYKEQGLDRLVNSNIL